ncbi:hypothetical protein EGW08_021070 [Elysia chlorotica]|uniref:Uncharacterized protein n=1 Tax=Elysia chlorotica TaxID=188477 RepID=A0A3S1B3L5_ELYCH|nr:hypothetical protein EGW08_021070 [Elysia chlorotica]
MQHYLPKHHQTVVPFKHQTARFVHLHSRKRRRLTPLNLLRKRDLVLSVRLFLLTLLALLVVTSIMLCAWNTDKFSVMETSLDVRIRLRRYHLLAYNSRSADTNFSLKHDLGLYFSKFLGQIRGQIFHTAKRRGLS